MGRIRVLDEHLVNRIAAGEVVERPASVVKELVENSLDAGARSIEISAAGGGKRSLRVVDDGCGMDRDDALLALESHATSKLRSFDDLSSLATLGFRGEALPSIASVSRFVLRTSVGGGTGTEVEARGGRIQAVRECAMPRGTEIGVEALFFNVPARRKFLRADATELAHVVRIATHYALAHTGVRFRLEHEGRVLLEAPPVDSRKARVAQVHGVEIGKRLLPFDASWPGVRVSGFAARPTDVSPRRDAQHCFVNGRLVRDRVLQHALAEAYGDAVPRGSYPMVLLFLEMDPSLVDVNVHPQKTEVRFARASEVHDRVREAIGASLGSERAVPSLRDLRPADAGTTSSSTAAAILHYLENREASQGAAAPAGVAERSRWPGPEPEAPARPLDLRIDEAEGGGYRIATPLAQYRDSYIVAQDREGMLLVDQHVAHERVLFEAYLGEAEQNRVDVQRLLVPRTLEMSRDEVLLVQDEAPEFRRLGFLIEPFGEDAIRIDGVPSFTAGADVEALVRRLIGEAGQARSAATSAEDLRRKLVTTAACQAAIKVNYPLGREAMQRLLDDLFRTDNPTTCPHGRPIVFRLTLEEIERAFRRR